VDFEPTRPTAKKHAAFMNALESMY